jgi:hypothetical protein
MGTVLLAKRMLLAKRAERAVLPPRQADAEENGEPSFRFPLT